MNSVVANPICGRAPERDRRRSSTIHRSRNPPAFRREQRGVNGAASAADTCRESESKVEGSVFRGDAFWNCRRHRHRPVFVLLRKRRRGLVLPGWPAWLVQRTRLFTRSPGFVRDRIETMGDDRGKGGGGGVKPVDRSVGIPDFHATIHCALGIDPSKNLYAGDRPVPITDKGVPVAELFG